MKKQSWYVQIRPEGNAFTEMSGSFALGIPDI